MKKKLKLQDLKVQSFVTAHDNEQAATIKGGGNSDNPACLTGVPACRNTHAQICNPLYTIGILPGGDTQLALAEPPLCA
jgi:hypothetical protein